ncbi:MAG: hypothetical protein R3Y59_09685, partial [bacterium]
MREKNRVVVYLFVVVLMVVSSSTSGLFAQSLDSISLDTTTLVLQNSSDSLIIDTDTIATDTLYSDLGVLLVDEVEVDNDSIAEEQDTIVRPKELMRPRNFDSQPPKTDTLTEAEKRKRIE